MQADLLLHSGRIYTMESDPSRATAVAIGGNRIVAVGSDADLRVLLRPGGQSLDLRGRAVVPGLIDAHVHFGSYCLGIHRSELDLDSVPTKEEAIEQVAEAARRTQPGCWIQGGGWNKNIWPEPTFPTASDLDSVAPDHPVALEDKSHHATWVNSCALRRAGITATTPDPPGGQILRDQSGAPTGLLLETAADLVHSAIPEPDLSAAVEALRLGMMRAQGLGLTGVHDPGSPAVLAALQVLRTRGELGLRALVHIPTSGLHAAREIGLRSGLGDAYLRIGGTKIFADGALGPQTAHMLSPYEGSVDNGGSCGIPTHSSDDLLELVRQSHSAGFSVHVHAIGDAANRAVLDALESAKRAPDTGHRPPREMDGLQPGIGPVLPDSIEHVQLLHPADVPRLASLGIVASMQPIHATSDMAMAERHWGRRCDMSYAWRSLLDSGARLAFGSDCPVETLDPLAGIHAAVTRRRADGSPGPEGWIPAQRLTVTQAVHAYTLGAAYASGEAHLKGSLVEGKLADLVVLSQDPFRIAPMGILDIRVDMTIFDGKLVYDRHA